MTEPLPQPDAAGDSELDGDLLAKWAKKLDLRPSELDELAFICRRRRPGCTRDELEDLVTQYSLRKTLISLLSQGQLISVVNVQTGKMAFMSARGEIPPHHVQIDWP